MGIDPGSHYTGYGVVLYNNGHLLHREHGVISLSKKKNFYEKLHSLHTELHSLFKRHRPQETVLEKIFFGKNADSAFKLGHIRGICLQKATEWKSQAYEYSSSKMKKSVTGKGNASKTQVREITFYLLQVKSSEREDASDALALALCHAKEKEILHRLEVQSTKNLQLKTWI